MPPKRSSIHRSYLKSKGLIINKHPQRLFYLNSLFDLQMGNYPVHKVARSSAEMTVLFGFMGSVDDKVLVDVDISPEYTDYLQSLGIECAQPVRKGSFIGFEGVAWGWDKHALARLWDAGATCEAPDLSAIKKVNSREFCSEINRKFGLGVPGSIFCKSHKEFSYAFSTLQKSFPLVIKPAFGTSGFGFLILRTPSQALSLLENITTIIDLGGAVVEPWCERVYDLSSSVTIFKDGTIGSPRFQRFYSNKHGAFYGILLEPSSPVLHRFAPELSSTALQAASALAEAGYYGRAGFDSFVYKDSSGNKQLAPIIEINARHSMSDIAHAIWNKYARHRWCLFRFISHKKCKLPDTYKDWNDTLGDDLFRPSDSMGVILLTPLCVAHDHHFAQPSRKVFFIASDSQENLCEVDKRLREKVIRA